VKIAWFDLSGKIGVSEWKISNLWVKLTARDYLAEIQKVTKRKNRKHCHF